jgi:transposase
MGELGVVGVDLGKNLFHIVGLDARGSTVLRKKVVRSHLLETFVQIPRSVVGMEACSGAQFFAARLRELGHDVRLIPGQFVKPYRKAQKNDFNDAEAIAEATSRGNMRFSRVRSTEELELQAIHRARDRTMREYTGLANQIRAFLIEAGIAIRQGRAPLARRMSELLDTENTDVSPRLRRLLATLWEHYAELGRTEQALTRELEAVAKASEPCRRLLTIPGIGVVTATALVSSIGDAKQFRRARDLSAWIGLVPRQFTTGGKPKLLGIRKGGNPYLRKMLVNGARSALAWARHRDNSMLRWFKALCLRVHPNVAVVALANKLARVSWAILTKEEVFSTI